MLELLLRLDETLSRLVSDFLIFPSVLPPLRPLPALLAPLGLGPPASLPVPKPLYPADDRFIFFR